MAMAGLAPEREREIYIYELHTFFADWTSFLPPLLWGYKPWDTWIAQVFSRYRSHESKRPGHGMCLHKSRRTAKLPMDLIGTAQKPRCLLLGPPPVQHLSQKTTWSDIITFRKWSLEKLLPFLWKLTSRCCALLMYNCGPHGIDFTDIGGQGEIITHPPNCTEVHQPLDMGIIAAFKSRYREILLRTIEKDKRGAAWFLNFEARNAWFRRWIWSSHSGCLSPCRHQLR